MAIRAPDGAKKTNNYKMIKSFGTIKKYHFLAKWKIWKMIFGIVKKLKGDKQFWHNENDGRWTKFYHNEKGTR